MGRRRRKFDIYLVILLSIITLCYFVCNHFSAEDKGFKIYKTAIETYKKGDFENAYKEFGRVKSGSSLKDAALFRQARCATALDKKELAIKKYNKIIHSKTKSSIVAISEYNMAVLMIEQKDKRAAKHFKNIIKKHPTSDYATASSYYLGIIETEKFPSDGKKLEKAKNKALIDFKTYLEKAPDGRFAINSINEILKLDVKLSNYDNLLIAKTYYANGEYEKAREYLDKTTLSESWADFVKTEFKLGNADKVKYYTEYGLKDHAAGTRQEDVYEAIDNCIRIPLTQRRNSLSCIQKL